MKAELRPRTIIILAKPHPLPYNFRLHRQHETRNIFVITLAYPRLQLAIKTFFYFVSSDKLHLRHSKKAAAKSCFIRGLLGENPFS
jgi:hypothetical protein